MISYKVYSRLEDIIELEGSWKELELVCKNTSIGTTFDWCMLWWKNFHSYEDNVFGYNKMMIIVVGYETKSNRIICIIPFVRLSRS